LGFLGFFGGLEFVESRFERSDLGFEELVLMESFRGKVI